MAHRLSVRAAALAVLACAVSACSTPRDRAPSESLTPAATFRPAAPVPSQAVEASRLSSPAVRPDTRPVSTSLAAAPKESRAGLVASEIRGNYEWAKSGPETLIVRNRVRQTRGLSLFEQAIALSRIRSRLAAELGPTAGSSARLRDGEVSVEIGSSLPPDRAADLIVSLLAIDGVESVRASLR